jgi:putative tricarboxylic transport membrane protein
MLDALAQALAEALGCPLPTVSARPGDDGAEAILHLAAHPGHPALAGSCTPTYFTTPLKRHMNVTYRELTPLAGLVADTYLLVVRHDHPATDAVELLAGRTTAAAAPRGGNTHIQAMLLRDTTSQEISIEFHDQVPAAVAAVREGRADWTTGVLSDVRAELDAGRLRILATFAPLGERGPAPSLREQGIDLDFALWRGLIGPPRLGRDAVTRWSTWLRAAIDTEPWRAYLADAHLRPAYLSPEEFAALLDSEAPRYERWSARLTAA